MFVADVRKVGKFGPGWVVGLVFLAAPALSVPLHAPGATASASAQFSGVTDGDSDPQSATASVTGTTFPGTGFASAVYNGPVRVRANSAPDGTGQVVGDSIAVRASMATVNRFTSGTLAPGTLVDAFVNLSLGGRIVNLGNRSAGLGSIEMGASFLRERGPGSALHSALLIFEDGSITTNTGFGTQLVQTDIITGNPFVDVVYADSIPIQMEVGELFSVELVVQAITGVTHRGDFSNTASFTITPITAGIVLEVIPSVPEPSAFSLLLAAAVVGSRIGRKTSTSFGGSRRDSRGRGAR